MTQPPPPPPPPMDTEKQDPFMMSLQPVRRSAITTYSKVRPKVLREQHSVPIPLLFPDPAPVSDNVSVADVDKQPSMVALITKSRDRLPQTASPSFARVLQGRLHTSAKSRPLNARILKNLTSARATPDQTIIKPEHPSLKRKRFPIPQPTLALDDQQQENGVIVPIINERRPTFGPAGLPDISAHIYAPVDYHTSRIPIPALPVQSRETPSNINSDYGEIQPRNPDAQTCDEAVSVQQADAKTTKRKLGSRNNLKLESNGAVAQQRPHVQVGSGTTRHAPLVPKNSDFALANSSRLKALGLVLVPPRSSPPSQPTVVHRQPLFDPRFVEEIDSDSDDSDIASNSRKLKRTSNMHRPIAVAAGVGARHRKPKAANRLSPIHESPPEPLITPSPALPISVPPSPPLAHSLTTQQGPAHAQSPPTALSPIQSHLTQQPTIMSSVHSQGSSSPRWTEPSPSDLQGSPYAASEFSVFDFVIEAQTLPLSHPLLPQHPRARVQNVDALDTDSHQPRASRSVTTAARPPKDFPSPDLANTIFALQASRPSKFPPLEFEDHVATSRGENTQCTSTAKAVRFASGVVEHPVTPSGLQLSTKAYRESLSHKQQCNINLAHTDLSLLHTADHATTPLNVDGSSISTTRTESVALTATSQTQSSPDSRGRDSVETETVDILVESPSRAVLAPLRPSSQPHSQSQTPFETFSDVCSLLFSKHDRLNSAKSNSIDAPNTTRTINTEVSKAPLLAATLASGASSPALLSCGAEFDDIEEE